MKKENEIIEKINDLKLEAYSINKIMEKPKTDYDVWKSLNLELIECAIKLEILEWVLNK